MAAKQSFMADSEAVDVPHPELALEAEADEAARHKRLLKLAKEHLCILLPCLLELENFLARLEPTLKTPPLMTGLPAFIRTLKREQKTLAGLLEDGVDALKEQGKKLDAAISVISHAALQWSVLKRSHSFVAVNRTFQGSSKDERRRTISRMDVNGREKQLLHRTMKTQAKVEVDVVDGGREWITIKSLHADRLARQMSDCGWGWGDYKPGDCVNPEEWEDIPIAKYIKRLIGAARANRHEYRLPRIRVLIANLERVHQDFDVLLQQFSTMDPSVQVIIEDMSGSFMNTPPPELEAAIENLIGDEYETLTETLNIDHTILVDLSSDLAHLSLQPQPWQGRTTRAQIVEENSHEGGLMLRTLYPILDGRTLVCTKEAAEHFHEMMQTVGTDTEKERGRLLVPLGDEMRSMTDDAIRTRFQALTIHRLPPTVQIPIRILPSPWTLETIHDAIAGGTLPHVARDVAHGAGLKSSKLSIYMYGWASGNVTVTSNKEIYGQMRTWVETHRRAEHEVGPAIWKVGVTRNLLAKSATPREGSEWADVVKPGQGEQKTVLEEECRSTKGSEGERR